MKFANLVAKCDKFEKLAQNASMMSNTRKPDFALIKAQLQRAANLMPSAFVAKQIFDHIKDIRDTKTNPQDTLNNDSYYSEANKILIQLQFFEEKNPKLAQILNAKNNMLTTIKNNLTTLIDSKDFSQYRQYTILQNGQDPVLDIDEWQQQQDSKNDLGF